MTDPKLIETMLQARVDAMNRHAVLRNFGVGAPWTDADRVELERVGMAAALAAINASGTHWVAPVEATGAMLTAESPEDDGTLSARAAIWAAMRTAYLAEPKEKMP